MILPKNPKTAYQALVPTGLTGVNTPDVFISEDTKTKKKPQAPENLMWQRVFNIIEHMKALVDEVKASIRSQESPEAKEKEINSVLVAIKVLQQQLQQISIS